MLSSMNVVLITIMTLLCIDSANAQCYTAYGKRSVGRMITIKEKELHDRTPASIDFVRELFNPDSMIANVNVSSGDITSILTKEVIGKAKVSSGFQVGSRIDTHRESKRYPQSSISTNMYRPFNTGCQNGFENSGQMNEQYCYYLDRNTNFFSAYVYGSGDLNFVWAAYTYDFDYNNGEGRKCGFVDPNSFRIGQNTCVDATYSACAVKYLTCFQDEFGNRYCRGEVCPV